MIIFPSPQDRKSSPSYIYCFLAGGEICSFQYNYVKAPWTNDGGFFSKISYGRKEKSGTRKAHLAQSESDDRSRTSNLVTKLLLPSTKMKNRTQAMHLVQYSWESYHDVCSIRLWWGQIDACLERVKIWGSQRPSCSRMDAKSTDIKKSEYKAKRVDF